MQAVGPVLIVLFAFSLIHLAGATQRLSGWMTFFGATILMTVSLVEITFYISALHADPATMPYISLVLISAVQHLYFIVAAPSLFLPPWYCASSVCSPPPAFWISRPRPGHGLCRPGSRLHAPVDITRVCAWFCRSASAVVVKRGRHPYGSQRTGVSIARMTTGQDDDAERKSSLPSNPPLEASC
jgi:hypothetical protein